MWSEAWSAIVVFNRCIWYTTMIIMLLPAFQCCMRKMRETGKNYHTSDIATWLDSAWIHIHHSHDTFYQDPTFSRATLNSWEPWMKLSACVIAEYDNSITLYEDFFHLGDTIFALTIGWSQTGDALWWCNALCTICSAFSNFSTTLHPLPSTATLGCTWTYNIITNWNLVIKGTY